MFRIPPGRRRVTVDNVGGDWAVVSWYEFRGAFADWTDRPCPGDLNLVTRNRLAGNKTSVREATTPT